MIDLDHSTGMIRMGVVFAYAAVALVAVAPLQGALVRYRVNYVPKTVQLLSSEKKSGDQAEERSLRPRVPGFFHTLGRVKKIEVSLPVDRIWIAPVAREV